MTEGANSTTQTSTGGGLLDRLLTRGYEFGFFRAVWLLERFVADGEPVGHRGPVGKESFRFRPDVSLGFPATDITRIAACNDAETGHRFYRIDETFLGIYGVSTPLPLHYAFDILRDAAKAEVPQDQSQGTVDGRHGERADDSTPTRDFLDIFHHRLISLFYRSCLKYRYSLQFGMTGRDTVTSYLLWLLGLSKDATADSIGLPPLRLIRYAGALTQHPKSATVLGGIISDYWEGLDTRVEQCVGRWMPIPLSDMNRMGGVNCSLGESLTVGEQIYDLNGAINVALGPVSWEAFQAFLPDGLGFQETRSLIRLYCTDPLSFTIEVELLPGEVPEMRLGGDEGGGRLGYTSWIRTDEVPATSVFFDSESPGPLPQLAPAEVPDDERSFATAR